MELPEVHIPVTMLPYFAWYLYLHL